ncbi:MAG: hypothetical protein ACI3Y0_09745 [Prevotella sp.]
MRNVKRLAIVALMCMVSTILYAQESDNNNKEESNRNVIISTAIGRHSAV